MTMFHEDLAGEEAPFGVVTFAGADAARLPARGSAVVQAQVRNGRVDHDATLLRGMCCSGSVDILTAFVHCCVLI